MLTIHVNKMTAWDKHRTLQDMIRFKRDPDVTEWEIASGLPYELALELALQRKTTWAASTRVETLCAWGVEETCYHGVGEAWLVASKHAEGYVHALHRHFKAALAEMLKLYPCLIAISYEMNVVHHMWMTAMGFRHNGVQFINGGRFLRFTINREDP